jgi:5-methylcytosine-specific restriction protein A
MPYLPSNTKCTELNCKNKRTKLNTYCLEHGGIEYSKNKQVNNVYQSAVWRSIRIRQLSKQPLCQACLLDNRVESAQHIDHVFPWKQIGDHAFINNLFQSLCAEHHSHKTHLEQRGIFMHYSDSKAEELSKHDYNAKIL